MVVIHLKVNDLNQFLYESHSSIEISELIKELITVNNLRIKIDQVCISIEDLMKHGPLKPEDVRGLKKTENLEPDIEDKYKIPKIKMPDKVGTLYNDDPTGFRTGWVLEEGLTKTVLKGVEDAKHYIHIKRLEDKKYMKIKELSDILEILKAGVMIAYPCYTGLPEWEPCILLLEDKDLIIDKEIPNLEYFKYDTTSLWNSGKEYERGKYLSDYIGKNEKTKIICRFNRKGSGAPVREPLIDKETHSKMLSYYYKKQEEIKKLEGNNDDSYFESKWADPKGLKKSLYNNDIKWKFK